MGTLEIHARRWFQRTYGNTYHSVRVVVDGETVGVRSDVYGYGRHYLHTAGEILKEAGYDLEDGYELRTRIQGRPAVVILDGEPYEFVETCEDVTRKRDLLPSWWVEAAKRDADDAYALTSEAAGQGEIR